MATFYSSFFSSGLLAADADGHRPRTPDPTTPRAFKPSFDDATPTASNFSLPASASSNDVIPSLLAKTEAIAISADRPRMRRRRSSLSLSSSPVASLKGTPPMPRATVHLQRQSMPMGLTSPGRTRSGSVTESISFTRSAMSMAVSDATMSNTLMGRLRSGSVGNSLRSASRRFRKPAAANAPAPPPPTVPLPAPPKLCLPPSATNLSALPQTPRRPLTKRAQTTDSIPILVHTPSVPIPGRPSVKDDSLPSSPLVSSFMSAWSRDGETDEEYPVPMDTPGETRGEYFA